MTEIYPSREAPQEYSSRRVVEAMQHPSARFIAGLAAVADHLNDNLRPGDVLIVLSAGDADQVSALVLAHLSEHEVNNG